ncbi:MAG: flagellar biosynthetic protein FliO [Paraglaciecola sp.]|uniref:flagellar biosynthetic protein FliO n=1 Tax=Pseudomonadati TaxID=3379134 RepID=UPI00273D8850|nr:flagellar biosynthetic protein FliO [Paraglaciecola sp.]MDP5032733.1 flagellar biosynthetic protein FliO [Paraglaciecola sp.]MDP5039383.1 flagellar biosynthetic protein FliO [Paraglaciecola sp.]MDP5132214.1 flagellar biosynthetic protein FliO [Paraglaciecola sp.]
MLLVNWKESKNSGSKLPLNSWAWIALSPLFLLSFSAQSEPQSLSNSTSVVSIFLSLLLVIAVVFMLAFLMRRFNVTHAGSSQLKVVASMMAGTRERVMVIEVGDEQHLIGVTAHNINHLAKLSQPLAESKPLAGDNFKDKLAMFMAGKINPSQQQDKVSTKGRNDE